MIGIFPIGILSALSAIGAVPFVRCDQCTSINACNQTGRCRILEAQNFQRQQDFMNGYAHAGRCHNCQTPQYCSNIGACHNTQVNQRPIYDPNVIDLPADAVREVRAVPVLAAPTEAQIAGEHPPSVAFIDLPYDWKLDRESEGGNCD